MKRLHSLLALAAILLFAACSRSVEGETSAFESNKRRVGELKALYAGFSAPLDAEMAKAQSAWDAAAGISDEEKKIEKMAEANGYIGAGWVGDLADIDAKKRKLRDEASRLSTKAKDPNARMSANSISSNANMTVNRVDSDLRMATPADANGAAAIVRRATEDLRAAQRMVDDFERSLRSKNGSGGAGAKGGDGSDKAQEAAPTSWNCGYCGKVNDMAAHECGGCGAQKK